ncbi:MAG TPA: hypothetical protein VJR58_21650 [Vineibacter sp.]|nr:hypothetical protein [Vineibacter sp.]
MAAPQSRDAPSHSVHLHPWIFKGVVGFVLLMLLAAWGFSATWSSASVEAYTGLALGMVSYLCLIAVGLAYAMSRFTRLRPDPARTEDAPARLSFRDWRSREIEVGDGHQRGSHVAIDILLAPAAVAIGLTILVIVWHLAPAGG